MTQKPATAPQMNRRIVIGTGTAAMGAVLLGRPGPALAQAKMDHPNPMPGELRAVLERNPALPATAFKFTPPAGADVVGE